MVDIRTLAVFQSICNDVNVFKKQIHTCHVRWHHGNGIVLFTERNVSGK